jgi:hypothetical protein
MDAITRPEGLNYQGIKRLRTAIGEMLDTGILPADISRSELGRIYGALSDDLGESVARAGGARGLQLWQRANNLNRVVSARRERLAKVVGLQGDAAPAQVYQRIVAAAQSRGRADTRLLVEARNAMGSDNWRDFAGSYIGQMGRAGDGTFSPQRFVTEWNKLSDRGKQVLFDAAGMRGTRQALDDIATILDDVSVMTKVAAKKTSGVLGDDLALNAQQVAGVRAERELPVVWAVAKGSFRNKLILVPAALAISALAPWAIMPLLMLGGAFLCFEGVEKLAHAWLHREEAAAHRAELAQALAEFGRIEKTLHTLTYIDDESKRRATLTQLNRGEGRHSLARAVFHGKRGELRQRYREGQEDQLGALGLVVNIIVLWNTLYMTAAVERLKQHGYPVLEEDLARLSPLIYEHINMLGRYSFAVPEEVARGELRPCPRQFPAAHA